jgi:glucose-1-phosphate cytidylyltransferase
MKVLILAGGYGTRISEETILKPKPMVEIGGRPILWHIMKIYSYYNFNEFVILLGYKGNVIKDYFINYFYNNNDFTINMNTNEIEILNKHTDNWKITLLNTGLNTKTGGRIKRAKEIINNQRFLLTYGDGVSDVNIDKLIETHIRAEKLITLTAVQPEGRFGAIYLNNNGLILNFKEKKDIDNKWINGGFFVCEPQILDFIEDDSTIFESDPLENLAKAGQLVAYKHYGFWKCMDNINDMNKLNEMYINNHAKWKKWI